MPAVAVRQPLPAFFGYDAAVRQQPPATVRVRQRQRRVAREAGYDRVFDIYDAVVHQPQSVFDGDNAVCEKLPTTDLSDAAVYQSQ